MATPIKRIEKDYLLKSLYDERIPIMYLKGQIQHILMAEKPSRGQMTFRTDRPIEGLKVHRKLNLMFDYWGQVIMFSVVVSSIKDDCITTNEPELLYKDLDRSFSRVSVPPNLQVQFTFLGDRYSLSYPKITEYENDEQESLIKTLDPKNLSGLIDQMASWIKNYASSYKLVIFKDTKPSTIEERLVAKTGKCFYLPSTSEAFPKEDHGPVKRLITEELFRLYLESTGVPHDSLDDACAQFLKEKHESGIFSELWVPILFQEYVIGHIHIWSDTAEKPPLDSEVIDTLYQFAKILAYSLKINGYFEAGKIQNDSFEGKIIDISASGMLFTYPISSLASKLVPATELSVQLKAPRRVVNTKATIVRRYRDNTQGYFGCRFINTEPEDLRFLFEFIYGKPFTGMEAAFFSGQV